MPFVFVDENKQNLNQGGAPRQGEVNWWKPGVQIFSEISTWIFAPIILALIGGKALDAHYGTKPLMLLILAGLGFLISSFGIARAVKNYMQKLKEKTNIK